MIIVSKEDNEQNSKRLFTIEYTREELDKITLDFVTQMNNYIASVNNRIIKTLEEIEKEETTAVVVLTGKKSSSSYNKEDVTTII
ncbi:MAG: hypothetical protein K0S93_542 [Nitrososphaeraceae archaeon]|nr:hypothetical protein [Nitrososphaeraceae archaeon]